MLHHEGGVCWQFSFLLAGLSAPSPTNPFNITDQPKPTLNQMRTSSPVPSIATGMTVNSMTYSASLPLPLSSIPPAMTLPASMSAFPQAGAGPFPELPCNLPQPLLPLSGSGPSPLPSQGTMNPFLWEDRLCWYEVNFLLLFPQLLWKTSHANAH